MPDPPPPPPSDDDASTLAAEVKRILELSRGSAVAQMSLNLTANIGLETIFDEVPEALRESVLERSKRPSQHRTLINRAAGSLVGLAVADGLGHNFEFWPACEVPGGLGCHRYKAGSGPRLEYPARDPAKHPGGEVINAYNKFCLQPGQWTDDTSMGLCLADSLLLHGGYDGSHLRALFLHWWFHGFNNAFRLDPDREGSVGLGGNIAASFHELRGHTSAASVPPRVAAKGEDAGNGSLMRLAAVPLFFHADADAARSYAYESSLATHPGPAAGEACAFMATLIQAMLGRPEDDATTPSAFLDAFVSSYMADGTTEYVADQPGGHGPEGAREMLHRLLRSSEAESSTERCWNWRHPTLGIERTLRNRGHDYNGFPVSSGYFGSYSMDALAMALHCFYHTTSFNAAVVKCVNFCGDADTTGAITAQLCGAFYGLDTIEPAWLEQLHKWDQQQIELRAVCLVHAKAFGSAGGTGDGS